MHFEAKVPSQAFPNKNYKSGHENKSREPLDPRCNYVWEGRHETMGGGLGAVSVWKAEEVIFRR